ncbi:unnamed protein product [marine sediment metagenome]|uniref:Replication protein n=1 Tax=marine sediment metagenome TaxID=412755 RepID=X1J8H4_9ZZZZ
MMDSNNTQQQKSIKAASSSPNSPYSEDVETGLEINNNLKATQSPKAARVESVLERPVSAILQRGPRESLLEFSKREFKSRQIYWESLENPALLVLEQLTPDDIQRIKQRVDLCGLIKSPVYQWCDCGFRRGEFQCNYAHLCKKCAKRKARKISKSIKENIRYLPTQIRGWRQKRLRFLTLTIVSTSDPLEARSFLVGALNRFLNRKLQKDKISGCISSIHTEKSKFHEGLYHVHFHLMVYSSWLDVRDHTLSNEWKTATKGAGSIVHIEVLRNQNQAIDFLSNYLLKHNPGSFEERLNLFYRKRYFFRHGCFNKGSPKHIFFFQEEVICAVCFQKISVVPVNSEEGQYFGDLDPPHLPKPITRFYAVCPSCCEHTRPEDWDFEHGMCELCAKPLTLEGKREIRDAALKEYFKKSESLDHTQERENMCSFQK